MEIYAVSEGARRDATESAALAQDNREDTEKLGKNEMHYRQQGQKPYLRIWSASTYKYIVN